MKMIEDHYNRVVAKNEKSNHTIIESNVKDNQNGERSLKLYNLWYNSSLSRRIAKLEQGIP